MSVHRSLMRLAPHRIATGLALALLAAGCSDATGPSRTAVQPQLADYLDYADSPTALHILRQAPTAPPLQTYQVSFWAYKGRPSTVAVNYQPVAGDSVGQPFLQFDIPKNGLLGGAGGVPLDGGDSVFVTMTIDTVRFFVHFQPSGVRFSIGSEARLVLWYGNANLDLNGDGVVDATDQMLRQQLAVWYQATKTDPWFKLSSSNDLTQPSISTAVYHFSDYAVSW